MSTGDVSTRRSRRTPTTPSRYGKDFIMESGNSVKKEPKGAVAADPLKPPRGPSVVEDGEQATRNKKQSSPKQAMETSSRTTRRSSKRIGNIEELPQEGLSGKKKHKRSKEAESKKVGKSTLNSSKTGGPSTPKTAVHDGEDREPTARVSESSPSKNQLPVASSHLQPVVPPSTEGAPIPRDQNSEDRAVEERKQLNISSNSSVFKALKEAIASYRSASGESVNKANLAVSVVRVQPSSPTTATNKVNSGGGDARNGDKAAPSVVTVHPAPSQTQPSSPSQLPKTQSKKTSATRTGSTGKGSPNKRSSKMFSLTTPSPVKKIQVNIIRSNQSSQVGLLGEQRPNLSNPVKMVPPPRGSKQTTKETFKPVPITTDMVSKISVKGRTTSTQTCQNDLQVLTYINKNIIKNCAHKVMTVSSSKVSKPNFRIANSSHRTKHCQTASELSDINFIILDAIGREEEVANEHSLSYAGEESSDVDKKIQWMLFGQDLETAMTDTMGGIPSNVVEKGQTGDKTKPKNAKISIESWSLALTVLNPSV